METLDYVSPLRIAVFPAAKDDRTQLVQHGQDIISD